MVEAQTVVVQRALLLNASFEPMRIVSWQKAMVLWFQDKVEVLEFHSVGLVRSVRENFRVPSILKLKSYIKVRHKNVVRFSKENIHLRDHNTCQYCGKRFTPKHLTLDHVVPASQGGPKTWTNVVSACLPCNQKKANRTPENARMPLLNRPIQPKTLPYDPEGAQEKRSPESWRPFLQARTGLAY